MSKVLIALDYAANAQKVAEAGLALAKSMAAEVVLLHVIADASYYVSKPYSPILGSWGYVDINIDDMDMDSVEKLGKLYLDKIKQQLGDVNIETVVREGDFADTISRAAKEFEVSLIVIGSHSHSWLEDVLIGNVTKKVLRQSKIPVCIIPSRNTK